MNQQTQPSPKSIISYVAIASSFPPSGAWRCISAGPDQDQGRRAVRAQPLILWRIDRCRVAHSVDDLYPGRSAQSLPGCSSGCVA